jgi:hypothetical protein
MKKRLVLVLVLVEAVLSATGIVGPSAVYAYDGEDDSAIEVVVEWIVHYDDLPDLGKSDDSAEAFYNALGQAGYLKCGHYNENNAWESDWKRNDPGWNGHDNIFTDNFDVAWFDGHGEPGTLIFNVAQDDEELQSFNYDRLDQWNPYTGPQDEARWGDLDLEWVFLNGCETLKYPAWHGHNMEGSGWKRDYDFGWALNGVHLICGWVSHKASKPDGAEVANYLLGWNLRQHSPVIEAWWCGTDVYQGSIKVRVIGENHNMENDWIWGQGYVTPDPVVDNYLYWWEWQSS